jgi:hypothetical protein
VAAHDADADAADLDRIALDDLGTVVGGVLHRAQLSWFQARMKTEVPQALRA